MRIIVPACARCNHHRGCQDLVPFLLLRPERLSSFLDYLGSLSPECLCELDSRIFAELYVAVAILNEAAAAGPGWRTEMERLCTGRALHRRRYAARRAVGLVSGRLASRRDREMGLPGPTCLLPNAGAGVRPLGLDEPLERLASRVLSVMALLWHVPADVAERELTRALTGSAVGSGSLVQPPEPGDDDVLRLDRWRTRPKRKRGRVDRRQGRGVRPQRAA